MRVTTKILMPVVGAALAAFALSPAQAATVIPVSATASSSYSGYDASYAIDQGGNSADTDWAAGSTGAGSYIDLTLGGDYNLTTAFVTDRVTSGGPNGAFAGGVTDFTTEYSLQAYTNSSFTTPIGTAQTFYVSVPGSPSSPASFENTQNVTGLDGEYIRYTILATNGGPNNNPGLSNIEFAGVPVPEPATWALFLIGFGALGFTMRGSRRKQLKSAAAV